MSVFFEIRLKGGVGCGWPMYECVRSWYLDARTFSLDAGPDLEDICADWFSECTIRSVADDGP
jgi:hypothetical protein